ncbi:MAG: plasma-membrane proton-efflux P-type ATPase [Dehalococcoidia bacterium]|nr:plasma-membrane proton-efflux P-type ATPase [Dehalococcoidia bacterium]
MAPRTRNSRQADAEHSSSDESALRTMPLHEFKAKLGFSPDGLTTAEASERLQKYGNNELKEEKHNPLLQFLSFFWGPIPGTIIVAAILSAFLRHWADLGVILTLLFMNAVIGSHEQRNADSAIQALQKQLALKAHVKRDARWKTIPSRDLVPGDLLRLRIGEIVPADSRILGSDTVEIDQSTLTGESLPVEKGQGDAAFSSSIMRQGETEALVYSTGQRSFYGKTAQLVEKTKTRSHLELAVLKIEDYLLAIAVPLGLLIIGAGLRRGDSVLSVVEFVLVLAVASVPVAMPAVMSVTMALGARVMAAKQAIVTRLPAIEEIAGIDILCSDKTGTLTQGTLTPGDPFTIAGVSAADVLLCAALSSRAEDNDPIDTAVLARAGEQANLADYKIAHFIPFDPVRKRTEAQVSASDGSSFSVSKGAVQALQALASTDDSTRKAVAEAVEGFARKGYRSLGVARTEQDKWRMIGVIPLFDPLREDTKATIDAAQSMGVKVKMVTGDQLAIAREIAGQLGLGQDILDASVFSETKVHQAEQLSQSIENAPGFAQVFPEHKYHIVDVLQQRGHIVGMTGDGVNDAPALKKADAGIAVSGATDAARAAASIVLLAPGLSTIVDAIRESRKIFRRMTNYATYRVAETVALLGFISLAVFFYNLHPVTAAMVVLLAILNDGAILSIAYDNVKRGTLPQKWNMREILGVATALGVWATARSFTIMHLGQTVFNLDTATLQTLIYLNLSIGGHLTLFAARTKGHFWTVKPSRILVAAVLGTQVIATLIAVNGILMDPLSWKLAGFVWAFSLGQFFIQDFVKLGAYRIIGRTHSGFITKRS